MPNADDISVLLERPSRSRVPPYVCPIVRSIRLSECCLCVLLLLLTWLALLWISILELVVALLESLAAIAVLLIALVQPWLAAQSLSNSIRHVVHRSGISRTAISIGSTESTISAKAAAATKATTATTTTTAAVSETATTKVGVTTNRHSPRSGDVGSLRSFGSKHDIIFDLFTLCKTLEAAIIVNGGMVDENLVHVRLGTL